MGRGVLCLPGWVGGKTGSLMGGCSKEGWSGEWAGPALLALWSNPTTLVPGRVETRRDEPWDGQTGSDLLSPRHRVVVPNL